MPFVGEIVKAERLRDGSVRIMVRRRDEGSQYAQVALTVQDAPPYFETAVVGTVVTGDGNNNLYVGGVKWMERCGYTRIKLAPKPGRKP